MKKKKENNFLEKYLCDKLDKLGIFHHKGNPDGNKGYPDRLVYAEHIYHIELKLGKENNSYYEQQPMQKKWQKTIENSGGTYLILTTREAIDEWVDIFYKECYTNKIENQFNWIKR